MEEDEGVDTLQERSELYVILGYCRVEEGF